MPHFVYRVRDASGAVRSGRIEASSQKEARARLICEGGQLEYLGPAPAPKAQPSAAGAPLPRAAPPSASPSASAPPKEASRARRLAVWLRRGLFALPVVAAGIWFACQRDIDVSGRLRVPGDAKVDDITYAFFIDGGARVYPRELKYEKDGRFQLRLRAFSLFKPEEVTGRVRLQRYDQLYIRGVPIINGKADLGIIHLHPARLPRQS